MIRFIALVAGLFVVGTASAAEPLKVSQRWALLVGVDDYAYAQKLQYCGADQRALAKQLIASGFPSDQVFLLEDKADDARMRPSQGNIERHLGLILNLADADDLVVIAFSGHGVNLDGKSFLCPGDCTLDDPQSLVSVDALYEQLKNCNARFKLVLVDACRNDPRPGGARAMTATDGTRALARTLQDLRPPEGVVLLNSCAPGEVSWEDEKFGHGVFMHFVLDALAGSGDVNRDGAVSLSELQSYAGGRTKTYVANLHRVVQRPFFRGDLSTEALEYALLPVPAPPIPGGDAQAYYQRGGEKFVQSRTAEAIADFDAALRLDPNHATAHAMRGVALTELGRLDEARQSLTKAIESSPQSWLGYVYRGRVSLKANDLKAALADAEAAFKLAPDELEVRLLRSRVRVWSGDRAGARTDVELILAKHPDNIAALRIRAVISLEESKFAEAIVDFERLVRLEPEATDIALSLAMSYMKSKRTVRAIEVLDAVIAREADNVQAFLVRGNLRSKVGKYREAIADFEVAIRLSPNDPLVLNDFAWILATSPDGDVRNGKRAVEMATRACKLTDYKESANLSTLAAAYAESGDFDAARKWIEQSLEIVPEGEQDSYRKELENYRADKPTREYPPGS